MTIQVHQCDRCGGMTVEVYDEMSSPDDTGKDVVGRRCVNCGAYVDELILQNRGRQQGITAFRSGLTKGRAPVHRSAPLSIHRRHKVA